MTAQKKNPTNSDIIRKLDTMDTRLTALESWKIAQDAGRAAVDEYKRQESNTRQTNSRTGFYDSIKDLMPYIILILGGIAVIIYAYAARAPK